MRNAATVTILALLLGLGGIASAAAGAQPPPKKPTGGGGSHGPSGGGASHGPTTGGGSMQTHGPTTGGGSMQTHGPTTGGGSMQTHGPTTGGGSMQTHGPTTGGGSMQTHGPTTGGGSMQTHGPTTGGGSMQTHGPTTGGGSIQTHGPTTGGGSIQTHGPTTGGGSMQTHGPTTGGATTHGPTTGGATTHGPTTGGTTTHGPTTGGKVTATPLNNRWGNLSGRTSTASFNHTATGGIAPKGSNTHITKGGSSVTTRSNGKVSDVHDPKRGIDVHHGLNGNRTISRTLPNHGGIVSSRGRPGYAQRGYGYHGHDFGRRAYYYHGHEYNRYYHGWGYRGLYMNVYAPGVFFAPGFYGWAYNPWPAPIAFGWGWGGAPWVGFYGGFFAPYPVYPSAAFWLTDYVISQDLQAAYAAQQNGGENDGGPVAAGGSPALTPEIKQQIADEVKYQLALENQEGQQSAGGQDVDPGSSGIARILADVANGHPHVFVAGGPLDLTDANGQECSISDGDVLQLQTAPDANATTASLFILVSKGGQECAKADTVTVQLTDLQEMQNQLRASIDQGLQELKAKQGTGGLPQAPPSAQAQPTQAPYAAIAPPPDPADATALQQQGQQADQTEQQATADTSQGSAAPAAQPPPN